MRLFNHQQGLHASQLKASKWLAEACRLRSNAGTLPPTDPSTFREIVKLAQVNSVEPVVYKLAMTDTSQYTAEELRTLKTEFERVQAQNLRRRERGCEILSSLQKAGIPFVVLKGNALADDLYQCPGYKKMNDIDLLVKRQDLKDLYPTLLELGLIPIGGLSREGARKQEKFSHHWPPFLTRDFQCAIGVHWSLTPPQSKIQISEDLMWNNLQLCNYDHLQVFRLSSAMMLLHLLVHLEPWKAGLKETMDIVNVAESEHFDKDQFLELLERCNALERARESCECVLGQFPEAKAAVLKAVLPNCSKSRDHQ
ncbi:MAG: nucleotidyltransferase family protein, partial [Pseudomonadota bacterium]